MNVPAQNSPEVLCAEILADAQQQGEEILRRARTEAEAILAAAETAAEKIRRDRREQAQAEASRCREMILSTVVVESARLRSAHVESLLESIRAEIRHRLQAQKFDAHECTLALAADAVRRLSELNLVLRISPSDHAAFGNRLAEEVGQRIARTPLSVVVSSDPAISSGAIIRDTAGFQVWDNRPLARLERLWPELRRQIAVRAGLAGENHSMGEGA